MPNDLKINSVWDCHALKPVVPLNLFFSNVHNDYVHLFNLIAEQNMAFVSCVEQSIYQSVLYIFLLQKSVAFNSRITLTKSRQITSVFCSPYKTPKAIKLYILFSIWENYKLRIMPMLTPEKHCRNHLSQHWGFCCCFEETKMKNNSHFSDFLH